MEFLNDRLRMPRWLAGRLGWLAARVGKKVDYVIDTVCFGSAIPLPSPSRSHSQSQSQEQVACHLLNKCPSIYTADQVSVTDSLGQTLPFVASAFSLSPSTLQPAILLF